MNLDISGTLLQIDLGTKNTPLFHDPMTDLLPDRTPPVVSKNNQCFDSTVASYLQQGTRYLNANTLGEFLNKVKTCLVNN